MAPSPFGSPKAGFLVEVVVTGLVVVMGLAVVFTVVLAVVLDVVFEQFHRSVESSLRRVVNVI